MIFNSIKSKQYSERFDTLVDLTIKNYMNEIDFDQNISLYDILIRHLAQGDFNGVFPSEHLTSLLPGDKIRVMKKVKEYSSLCFSNGDINQWTESVKGIPSDDFEDICAKLVDDYNFLIRLAKNGGEEALELLSSFQEKDVFFGEAIVDCIRSLFSLDGIAEDVILDMSGRNVLYNLFTDEEKASLCCFAPYVLFSSNEQGIVMNSPIIVAKKIYNKKFGEGNPTIEELRTSIHSMDDFDSVLFDLVENRANDNSTSVRQI